MLTGEMLCSFSCFISFEDAFFFLLVDKKDNLVLRNMGFRKDFSFLLSFFCITL